MRGSERIDIRLEHVRIYRPRYPHTYLKSVYFDLIFSTI